MHEDNVSWFDGKCTYMHTLSICTFELFKYVPCTYMCHYVFLFVVISCFASKGHHISSCNIWWAIFLIGVAMSYMYNDFWSPWFPFPSALNNRKHFMRRDNVRYCAMFLFSWKQVEDFIIIIMKKMSYFWISHLKPFTPDDKYV